MVTSLHTTIERLWGTPGRQMFLPTRATVRKFNSQVLGSIALRFCVLILSTGTGIGCTENAMPFQRSSALSERLQVFSQQGPQGVQLRLDQVTDFDWDTVYYFREGTLKSDVNEISKAVVFKDDEGRYLERGALLIFKHGNELSGAFAMLPPLHISGTNRKEYSIKEATLIAHTKDPGPYLLRFTD